MTQHAAVSQKSSKKTQHKKPIGINQRIEDGKLSVRYCECLCARTRVNMKLANFAQEWLVKFELLEKTDGKFGHNTLFAMALFQLAYNKLNNLKKRDKGYLETDGVLGRGTLAAMRKTTPESLSPYLKNKDLIDEARKLVRHKTGKVIPNTLMTEKVQAPNPSIAKGEQRSSNNGSIPAEAAYDLAVNTVDPQVRSIPTSSLVTEPSKLGTLGSIAKYVGRITNSWIGDMLKSL